MPPYPDPKAPFERTGAGDAFASTLAVALALGKTLEEALIWAPINSASVVQDVGAQRGLLNQTQLKEWLAKAPTDYKPRKI
jgi:ribokinase